MCWQNFVRSKREWKWNGQKPQLNRGSDQSSRISQVFTGHKFKFVTQLVSDLGEWKKLKLKICAVRGYDNNKAPTSSICPVAICLSLHLHLCVCANVLRVHMCATLLYEYSCGTRSFICSHYNYQRTKRTSPPVHVRNLFAHLHLQRELKQEQDQRTAGRKDYRTSVSLPSYTNKLISARHSKCLEHSAMFVIEYHAGGQDEISLPKRQPVGQIMQN